MKSPLTRAREDYDTARGGLQPKWGKLGLGQRLSIADDVTDGPFRSKGFRLGGAATVDVEAWWMWLNGGIGGGWELILPADHQRPKRLHLTLLAGPMSVNVTVTWGLPRAPAAPARDWEPGDPCGACGSRDTVWEMDGQLRQAHCRGCGRSDWDDD